MLTMQNNYYLSVIFFVSITMTTAFRDTCEGRWKEGRQTFAADWLKAYCVCRMMQLGCKDLTGPERTNWGVWYSYKFTYNRPVMKKAKDGCVGCETTKTKKQSITVLHDNKYDKWSLRCDEIKQDLIKQGQP